MRNTSSDANVVTDIIKISAAIISLSHGSNFLRNIGFLNAFGWIVIIFSIAFPFFLKRPKTQVGIALFILTMVHASNFLINARVLPGDGSRTIIGWLLIIFTIKIIVGIFIASLKGVNV